MVKNNNIFSCDESGSQRDKNDCRNELNRRKTPVRKCGASVEDRKHLTRFLNRNFCKKKSQDGKNDIELFTFQKLDRYNSPENVLLANQRTSSQKMNIGFGKISDFNKNGCTSHRGSHENNIFEQIVDSYYSNSRSPSNSKTMIYRNPIQFSKNQKSNG